MFLDASPRYHLPSTNPGAYHGAATQICILPFAEEGKKVLIIQRPEMFPGFTADKLDVITTATLEGYTIEMCIPLDLLQIPAPATGQLLGFDLAVNNALGADKANQQLF